MKVRVDDQKCTGCGICVDICPEVFELGEDGLARVVRADPATDGCSREAAENCPSEAITMQD